MRSFTKLKIRTDLNQQRFTHWLPLYFGETEKFDIVTKEYDEETEEMAGITKSVDTFERFEKHINQTMSFLTCGSTRKTFNGVQARTFMLKLIGTHVVDMMKENKHISIVAIRRLFNFIRLFLYFMKKDPSIEKEMNALVNAFINDPATRHKDTCKNMLDY